MPYTELQCDHCAKTCIFNGSVTPEVTALMEHAAFDHASPAFLNVVDYTQFDPSDYGIPEVIKAA